MADLKTILAKIATLEGDNSALIAEVREYGEKLEGKNFEIIGEKRNASARVATLEDALKAIAAQLGLKGDSGDLLSLLEPEIRKIVSDRDAVTAKLAESEKSLTELTTKQKEMSRSLLLADLGSAGVQGAALVRLLGDRVDQLTKTDAGYLLEGKPLREVFDADESLKPFTGAVFGETAKEEEKRSPGAIPPAPKLPASPGEAKNEKSDRSVAASYLSQRYKVPIAPTKQ